MPGKFSKYFFFALLVVMLAGMMHASRDAGISGDEEVHYRQSEMVYQYYATFGKDKAALHTPSTHLQYYGQAFDNVVTILIHWFHIDNIYDFRHIMCSLAGWFTVFITAWFAVSLSGYAAGIITLLLFAISATFLGHAQNNLKDIPFALAYISALFFMVKVVSQKKSGSRITYVLLTFSIALAIGIRAGGLLLVAYLFFFSVLEMLFRYRKEDQINGYNYRRKFRAVLLVSLAGYFLSLILWPYALQNPILNPWKSYQLMTHFPVTIRQIFEGKVFWSDFLPWYYLPKSMLITIPLLIWLGLGLFLVLALKSIKKDPVFLYVLLLFPVLFPPVFAILKNANLYGSWRHFLFIYPGIVLIAALGFTYFFRLKKRAIINWTAGAVLVFLAFHPVRFMVQNHPYYYLYYNSLVGGLRNAYGQYETDYYYHSIRKGSEWLVQYLEKEGDLNAKVGANFSMEWYLRHYPGLQFRYFSWDDRCQTDWDYAVVANSYIPPSQLRNKVWPPKDAIHVIVVDGVPVCAVLKRTTKSDLSGIEALNEGKIGEAIQNLKEALQTDPMNEVIYYYYAVALKKQGKITQADSILLQSLRVNEQYEPALLLLGRNAGERGDSAKAMMYCDRLISANIKYFSAYVLKAKLYGETETLKARKTLKECLNLNSKYKPAIIGLADTYRKSDPGIAAKYDNLAKSIK